MGRLEWDLEDAKRWADCNPEAWEEPLQWLVRCARFAVAQHERAERERDAERERADELARERNKALEEGDKSESLEGFADRLDRVLDREARALSRLAEMERALERLEGCVP